MMHANLSREGFGWPGHSKPPELIRYEFGVFYFLKG